MNNPVNSIVIYTTRWCGYCLRAKQLLRDRGLAFREIAVDGNAALRVQMTRLSGRRSVPQIWIGERHIGGCDDLMALERRGQLAALVGRELS